MRRPVAFGHCRLKGPEPAQEALPDAPFEAVDKDLIAKLPGQEQIACQLSIGICGEPGDIGAAAGGAHTDSGCLGPVGPDQTWLS